MSRETSRTLGPGFRSPGLVALAIVVISYSVVGALLVRAARQHQEHQERALTVVLNLERLQAANSGMMVGEVTPQEWAGAIDDWRDRRQTIVPRTSEQRISVETLDHSLDIAERTMLMPAPTQAAMKNLSYAISRAVQQFQVAQVSAAAQARYRWTHVVVVLGLALAFAFITILFVSLAEGRRLRAEDLSLQVRVANEKLMAAQSRLTRSEERYALAARGANDGLFDWDLLTHKMYFSTRFREMIGDFGMGDQPEDWLRYIHEEDRAAFDAAMTAALESSASTLEIEHRLRRADGTERWILTRAAIVHEREEPVRIAGALTDITDRRRVAAAEEKARLLEEATHTLEVGIALLDHEHIPVRSSEMLQRLTLEFGGVSAWWTAVRQEVSESMPPDTDESIVVEISAPDGRRRAFGLTWSERGQELTTDDMDAPFLLLVQDRTAAHMATERRIALSEQLREARDEALRASSARSRLLKRVGWELRAPLREIQSAVEQDGSPANERVGDATGLIEQIVDGMVELSRLEAREPTFRLEDISAQTLIAPLVIEAEGLAQATGNVFVAPRQVEGRLRTDMEAVREVLRELLANAMRFTVEGTVTLSVRLNPGIVRFQIRDTGVGVDPSLAQRLFEPFVRSLPPSGRETKGAGLGLALGRRTIERLGGHLEWRNNTSGGSSFSLELPGGPT